MRADPDRELVQSCQERPPAGLQGAFRTLYEQYRDRVYNVCYRITGNPADALDAAQETFGILFRKIGEFRFESRFSSWVYRIAVNASIDLKRRQRARWQSSLDTQRDGEAGMGPGGRSEPADESDDGPLREASRRELESEVQAAIGRLSEKMQVITVLRYVEGLSYEEIAETLRISLGTVKSRLARAHQALDRELTPVLDKHYLT
jgi:RNA polymerase sigma-70 factor (ECF subfamily)